MDRFVRRQLKAAGCERYIDLFRSKGYDELKYRSIRLLELSALLPYDDDDAVEAIYANVVLLRVGLDSTSSSRADVKVKVEPQILPDGPARDQPEAMVKIEGGGDDGPGSSSTRSRETSEPTLPLHIMPGNSKEPHLRVKHEQDPSAQSEPRDSPQPPLERETTIVKAEIETELANPSPKSQPTKTPHKHRTNGSSGKNHRAKSQHESQLTAEDSKPVDPTPVAQPKRRRFSRIRVISDSDDEDDDTDADAIVRASQIFPAKKPTRTPAPVPAGVTDLRVPSFSLRRANTQRGGGGDRFNGRINMHDLIHRRPVLLDMILSYEFGSCAKLSTLLRTLHAASADERLAPDTITILELTATDQSLHVPNSILEQIADLPSSFLSSIVGLRFGFAFNVDILPETLTELLTSCSSSLAELTIQRGLFGVYDAHIGMPRLSIPPLPHLKTLSWAKDSVAAPCEYTRPPPVMDIDLDDEPSSQSPSASALVFILDFGDCESTFPELVDLFIGVQIHASFCSIAQFPSLHTFNVRGSSSSWIPIDDTLSIINTKVTALEISADIVDTTHTTLFGSLPKVCPRLKKLVLNFPRSACLRAAIRSLAIAATDRTHAHAPNARITSLTINTRHEFESGFGAALMGEPCTELTWHDEEKLDELQMYAHWKPFMEQLRVELPEIEPWHAKTRDRFSLGIGALKSLKRLKIHHVAQAIHLPLGKEHWTSPDVKVSRNRWSYVQPPFPGRVLFEIAKLKATLVSCDLTGFQTDRDDAYEWERLMKFKAMPLDHAASRARDYPTRSSSSSSMSEAWAGAADELPHMPSHKSADFIPADTVHSHMFGRAVIKAERR